jgi:hypothetical protein
MRSPHRTDVSAFFALADDRASLGIDPGHQTLMDGLARLGIAP